MESSKYLVFVDESGDHVLTKNNIEFPVFVLAFCIFEKEYYCNTVLPLFNKLKLKYFKDLNIIFHERDIRKHEKDFSFLTKEKVRYEFFKDLNNLMQTLDFKVISTVIKKSKFINKYSDPDNPYNLATTFCLERLKKFLIENNDLKPTTVTFEARGEKENKDLQLSFLKEVNSPEYCGNLDIAIIDKKSNSAGLQIADLVARPIGRYVIDSSQENRAFEIIKTKLRKNKEGEYLGYGLKIFP